MDSEVLQLLALKQRDRAFEKLLEMYETKVFRLVMSMLHDAARAEEVCQDVFLKIWQSLEVYDPKRSAPGTWIYRVAQNTALTHLRNEAYRRTLPLNAIEEPCSAAASGGQDDIRRHVDSLPEDLRGVVVLYYYQERSVDEVAAMLELPAGTVKSHLSRARRMLAEQMKVARPQ